MKRLGVILAVTFLISTSVCDQALSAVITGQLLYNDRPLGGAVVSYFDAVNAELVLQSSSSDGDGYFKDELKEGRYKIHFSFITEKPICFDEFYNSSGDGENVFDLGTSITVSDDQVTDLGRLVVFADDMGRYCGPMECVPVKGSLSVIVFDSSTERGVPGIRVQFKDPQTGFPRFNEKEYHTDENGVLEIFGLACKALEVKIRFSDPYAGEYSAEYYGTTDLDDFSAGEVVNFTNLSLKVVDGIGKIPPADQVENIIDDILSILPADEAQPVVSSLEQGLALLQDANPNNDKGACGTLVGSANKLNGLIANGRLSQADADALAASIDALKNDLECKK